VGRLIYGPRAMAETTPKPAEKPSERKLASPFLPLLWILAPLIILVAYGLIFKY
jgi:hypothetical protein